MLTRETTTDDLDFSCEAMRPETRPGRIIRGTRYQVRLASGVKIATTGNRATAEAIAAATIGARVVEVGTRSAS